jgi:hypothetical protein
MKPITVTKTVFTLDELSDAARQNALEKMNTWMYEYIESDEITEYLNGELFTELTGEFIGEISTNELAKRTGLKLNWSLSHSQGDGVAIYGVVYAADAPKLEWHNADNARLSPTDYANFYSHENTFTVEVCGEDENGNYTTLDGDTGEEIAEQFRDICRRLKRLGYEQIRNLTGEEAIRGYLDGGDARRFTEDGDLALMPFWSDQ